MIGFRTELVSGTITFLTPLSVSREGTGWKGRSPFSLCGNKLWEWPLKEESFLDDFSRKHPPPHP